MILNDQLNFIIFISLLFYLLLLKYPYQKEFALFYKNNKKINEKLKIINQAFSIRFDLILNFQKMEL